MPLHYKYLTNNYSYINITIIIIYIYIYINSLCNIYFILYYKYVIIYYYMLHHISYTYHNTIIRTGGEYYNIKINNFKIIRGED